ncbi:hypothetical protein KA005_14795, partial [bacterium]|nr:hypothetical protein [bacterium]
SYEDEEVRTQIIRQGDLRDEVEEAGETVKWGQYLRGPDIYFEILGKCAEKLITLGKIVNLRYGVKTGLNKFFYLREPDAKHWRLEDKFLRLVVRSTKEVPKIFIEENKLTWKAFVCDKEKKELGGTNALRYIREAERKKWSNVPSVQARPRWWSLPRQHGADFLVLQFISRRHYSPINRIGALVGNVVFVGSFKKKQDSDLGCAIMNSSLVALSAEVCGRTNLGEGLLTIYGPDMDGMLLPNPAEIKTKAKTVLDAFRKLGRRKVLPFDQEHKRKDRIDFEKNLFEYIGLNEDDYEKVCAAVEEMIEERHLLPKLRTVKKKRRVEQDLGKLKEEVTEEILPSGVKSFPDTFVKASAKTEWEEIGIAAEEIKFGEAGMGVQEICDGEGNRLMEVWGIEKAKYIVYGKGKSEYVVKVPDSEIVIKKAVKDYEIYVRQIREELYKAFMEKCGDHNMSENLARQVCEEFGLPDLSS